MNLTTIIKPFEKLTPGELYAIMRLRNEVFIVEQNCVYQDADNKDPRCHHLMLLNNNHELMAYARLLPQGLSYAEMSIGRVISSPKARGTGDGRLLMKTAIEQCALIFGEGSIRIGAQAYLRNFYASFGFKEIGEIYDEDGIPHITMIKE